MAENSEGAKSLQRRWAIVLAMAAFVAGMGLYGVHMIHEGFSARDRPSRVEVLVARKARHWAIPSKANNLRNPMSATAEMLEHGRNHWADHCATCHANNGSGETEVGRNLYPKAPDMRRSETQSLSDGELYYIIRNGVRMTGMPAWGGADDGDHDQETWMLVLFIRHLPQLTADEERGMEKLNPKSAVEREEEQQEENFLNGTTSLQDEKQHEEEQ
jgi:mono/diheme cytochrome c family protein